MPREMNMSARSILKILLGLAGAVAVSQCYRHAG
jgi:hypothetical protein